MTRAEHLILPVAITSLLILAWLEMAWPLALAITIPTLIVAAVRRIHRKEAEWRRKWEVREQLYLAGDHRARPRR